MFCGDIHRNNWNGLTSSFKIDSDKAFVILLVTRLQVCKFSHLFSVLEVCSRRSFY